MPMSDATAADWFIYWLYKGPAVLLRHAAIIYNINNQQQQHSYSAKTKYISIVIPIIMLKIFQELS